MKNKIFNLLTIVILAAAQFTFAGCSESSGKSVIPAGSKLGTMSAYVFNAAQNAAVLTSDATGTITDNTVSVTVPYGADVSALVASFTASGSATVNGTAQTTGVTANDFTLPVSYAITAQGATTQDFVVVVAHAPNTACDLTAFSINGRPGVIDQGAHTIAVLLPFGTATTALVPNFSATGVTVQAGPSNTTQTSGVTAVDFSSPVTYRVVASSGTVKQYTVTVTLDSRRLFVTNNQVLSMVSSGNLIYIGGSFTMVGPNTGGGAPLDTTTARLPASLLAMSQPNSTVRIAIPDGNGGWYIGGDFTRIRGAARTYAARINADGSLHAWNPNANGSVYSLALSSDGNSIFVGGAFNLIGGQLRNSLAKLNTTTGAADATWNPGPNNIVRSIAVSGSSVYVGGDFSSTIGGQSRNFLAKLSDSGTGAADAAWDPSPNSTVYSITVSGSSVYVGGFFNGSTSIGGQSRNRLARLSDSGTGAADAAWDPSPNGLVRTIVISGGSVYVGGDFAGTIGGQSRNYIARLSVSGTGAADADWDPNANASVYSIVVEGDIVYAGGYFTTIGTMNRNYIAALDGAASSTGAATSWDPMANQAVLTLALTGSTVYAGGTFTGIAMTARNYITAVDGSGYPTSWDPGANGVVRSVAVSADSQSVYIGGDFYGSVGGQIRHFLAKVSASTGLADADWNPNPNGNVYSIALSGSSVYVGGSFNGSIGGQTRAYIARLSDSGTGAADATWDPNPNTTVRALAVSGGSLYAGGDFIGTIGGQTRPYIAKLSGSGTGAADPAWDAGSNNSVYAITVGSDSSVYAGGTFTNLGGGARSFIAKLSGATGAGDASWTVNTCNSFVFALALSSDGTQLYAGGSFSAIGGQSRYSIARLATSDGTAGAWDPNMNTTVYALGVLDGAVFAGGGFYASGPAFAYSTNYCALIDPVSYSIWSYR